MPHSRNLHEALGGDFVHADPGTLSMVDLGLSIVGEWANPDGSTSGWGPNDLRSSVGPASPIR